MKVRTIIGAASAAIAIATAAPASAHDVGDKSHAELRAGDTQHSGQVADRRGRRLSTGWGHGSAYPRKIVLHLRLRHFRKYRVRR